MPNSVHQEQEEVIGQKKSRAVERSDKINAPSIAARPVCPPNSVHQEQEEVIGQKRARAVWSEATKEKDPVVGSTGSRISSVWTIDQAVCAVVCLVTLSA
jgi:hypothetical protein